MKPKVPKDPQLITDAQQNPSLTLRKATVSTFPIAHSQPVHEILF